MLDGDEEGYGCGIFLNSTTLYNQTTLQMRSEWVTALVDLMGYKRMVSNANESGIDDDSDILYRIPDDVGQFWMDLPAHAAKLQAMSPKNREEQPQGQRVQIGVVNRRENTALEQISDLTLAIHEMYPEANVTASIYVFFQSLCRKVGVRHYGIYHGTVDIHNDWKVFGSTYEDRNKYRSVASIPYNVCDVMEMVEVALSGFQLYQLLYRVLVFSLYIPFTCQIHNLYLPLRHRKREVETPRRR